MRLNYLVKGFPGHPLHPPLTDAAIGAYTAALLLALADYFGIVAVGRGWWLALIIGLVASAFAGATGLIDWLSIPKGSAARRTATLHMAVMEVAIVLFGVAAIAGYGAYSDAVGPGGATMILMVAGFLALTAGGWLGGTVVFVHGVRVIDAPDEPTREAVAPLGEEDEQQDTVASGEISPTQESPRPPE